MRSALTRSSISTPKRFRISHGSRRLFSSRQPQDVESISGGLNSINVEVFRRRAFQPETPLHISTSRQEALDGLPAIRKWFIHDPSINPTEWRSIDSENNSTSQQPSRSEDNTSTFPMPELSYLSQFESTILPYEHFDPCTDTFTTFFAPLSLFLRQSTEARSRSRSPTVQPTLYIAQAQLIDLPPVLRSDLPTPHLVTEGGRGDVYDANLWMGLAPTYTPLHKDPNPNLFVQLAGRKKVRLFEPRVGEEIFREARRRVEGSLDGKRSGSGSGSGSGSSAMRGEEMMMGQERRELERVVWDDEEGCSSARQGKECLVQVGDALFIPKGWWHSIRSVGEGTTASVNWWFR